MVVPYRKAVCSILIVDDEDSIRMLIRDVLAGPDIRCTECRTCADTKFALEEQSFDIIFLDNRLSDGYGLDLIPAASENAPFVIFVSSDAHDEGLADEARRRGAYDILVKPFLPNDVLRFLGKRRNLS